MQTSLVLFLSVLFVAAVQARFIWQCPSNTPTETLDFKLLRGNWYVLGTTDKLGVCFNYTIGGSNDDYLQVNETHFRSFIYTKESMAYTVERETQTNKLTLRYKYLWLIPRTETWTIVSANFTSNKYMVLYKCGILSDESQIWVADQNLSAASGLSAPIEKAMESINYSKEDYVWKNSFDCYH